MPISVSCTTIIVCGIVRNAERGLKANIPVLDSLCNSFKDYRIIIYENDSTDKTKSILRNWQKNDPLRIHIVLENIDKETTIPKLQSVSCNPFFSHERISKMVNLRNKYMTYVEEQGWNADYLMVVDLDVAQLDINGILTSFDSDVDWDVVTAFGYSLSPSLKRRYHDCYACVDLNQKDFPQTEKSIQMMGRKFAKLKPSDKWVRVFSAFGGLAIYKFNLVKDLRYMVLPNNDFRVEARCEHFSIYTQMYEKCQDIKTYINPSMTILYQKINLKLVLHTIKRRILEIMSHR